MNIISIEVGKVAKYSLDEYKYKQATEREDDKKNILWSLHIKGDKTSKYTVINTKSKANLYTYAKMEIVGGKNKLSIVFDKALKGKKIQIEPYRNKPDIDQSKKAGGYDYIKSTTIKAESAAKITKLDTTKLWLETECDDCTKKDKEFLNGSFFKLKTPELLFPFRTIPLNHPDGFKTKAYKNFDYTLKEDNAATFGYKRGKPSVRLHAARDLYYDVDEPIYAIANGIVKDIRKFYRDTWVIEIEHEYQHIKGYNIVVRYGEVHKNGILVKEGDKVTRGQQIAKIGLLVPFVVQPYPDKRGMLHIEVYTGEESGSLFGRSSVKYSDMLYAKSTKYATGRSFKRRKDLIDPLPLLKVMLGNSKKEGLL